MTRVSQPGIKAEGTRTLPNPFAITPVLLYQTESPSPSSLASGHFFFPPLLPSQPIHECL